MNRGFTVISVEYCNRNFEEKMDHGKVSALMTKILNLEKKNAFWKMKSEVMKDVLVSTKIFMSPLERRRFL